MLVLDNRTLTLTFILITTLLVLLIQISRVSIRKTKGSEHWVLGNSLIAFAFILLYLQGYLPTFMSYMVANFLLLLGFIFLSIGVCQFLHQKISLKLYIRVITIYIVSFTYYVYFHFNTSIRIVIISILLALILADIAKTIKNEIPEKRKGIYIYSIFTFGTLSIYYAYRAVSTMFMINIPSIFTSDAAMSLAFMMMIFGVISWTTGLIIMNSVVLETELEDNMDKMSEEMDKRQLMEVQLKDINRKLSKLSTYDSLTGLYNRRYILERFESELARAKRGYHTLSLSIIDLDKFKNVNDTFGHNVGDEVLVSISEVLMSSLRQVDIIGRYGGEEFIVLFPNTNGQVAYQILDRIRNEIEDIDWAYPELLTTISGGIIEINMNNSDHDIKELISKADKALYTAKNLGRNRIELYND